MWIARNKNGTLLLDTYGIPIRDDNSWIPSIEGTYCFIESTLFQELKWEDEPIKVLIIYA